MRERALVLALLLALAAPGLARAEIGKSDVVPAATLLFPYFEVDPTSVMRQTTLITIQNASPNAVLTRVTLWTDLGVPTLGFDVYLTGYDTQAMNLYDIFARGAFQPTAPANVDPGGTGLSGLSPKGPFSTDISIPSCAGLLPYRDIWVATLTPSAIADLVAAHTGVATSAGTCSGSPRGDGIARGYVTVDTVSACSPFTSLPNAAGYFGAGGIVADQNVLLGDFMFIDALNNFANGENAVHIEADAALAGTRTFYARFTGATGADHRERLSPGSLVSLKGNRSQVTRSDAIVWRDPGVPTAPFACGAALPAPFPLPQQWATVVDDQSSLVDLTGDRFPLATGVTEIFDAPFAAGQDPRFGWFSLGLNAADQMWMIGRRNYDGRFEAAVSGPTTLAATLLLPHFEIAATPPAWPAGSPLRVLRQPRMLIGNANQNPVLAHVTLWTDLGVPTLGFDVYLAGHDVTEINLRMALEGVLPPTGPTVTSRGTPASTGPPVNFPNCTGKLPPPRLPASQVEWIKAAHRGLALPGAPGTCAGHAWGDGALRGYATVDVVNRCSSAFPGDPAAGGDPAYFVSGGTGIASNANVLWGEWWIEDRQQNQLRSDRLVGIRADNGLSAAGTYTFYGRRLGGSAADNRQRLPSVWQARWIAGGTGALESTAIVWRDPGARAPFACGSEPALRQREVTTFDEYTFAQNLSAGTPAGYDTRLPLAAERIPRVALRFPIATGHIAGFHHFDLRFPASTADALFGGANQAYVAIEQEAAGRFGVAFAGRAVEGVAGSMYPIP